MSDPEAQPPPSSPGPPEGRVRGPVGPGGRPLSPLPPRRAVRKSDPAPGNWAVVGVGVELAGVVAVLTLGGWWLDRRWDVSPWLTLTGAVLGITGGMVRVWKLMNR